MTDPKNNGFENLERNLQALAAMEAFEVVELVRAPADYKTRRNAVREYIASLRREVGMECPVITNSSSNHQISISVGGLDHFANYGRTDEKWSLLPHVHRLLRDAQYIRRENPDARKAGDPNIRAFHKFAIPVRLAVHLHLAVLTVREDANGHWFYDGGLNEVEIKKPADDYAGHSMETTPAIQQAVGRVAHTLFHVKPAETSTR